MELWITTLLDQLSSGVPTSSKPKIQKNSKNREKTLSLGPASKPKNCPVLSHCRVFLDPESKPKSPATNNHPTRENCWSTQIWSSRRLKNHRRRRHHHQKKKLRRSKEQNPKSPQFPHKQLEEKKTKTPQIHFFSLFFHFWMWISVLILISSWQF